MKKVIKVSHPKYPVYKLYLSNYRHNGYCVMSYLDSQLEDKEIRDGITLDLKEITENREAILKIFDEVIALKFVDGLELNSAIVELKKKFNETIPNSEW